MLRLKEICGSHLLQTPTSSPRASCPGSQPDGFWKSPRTETPQLPWATCDSAFTVKNCFLMFRRNLPCFSLWPLPLVLSLGITKNSLALSSLHLHFRYLYTWMRFTLEPSLLQAKQSLISQPFLIGEMLQFLIIFMAAHWTLSSSSISVFYWRAQNWPQYSRCGLTNAEQRGRITSLGLLGNTLLNVAQNTSSFPCGKGTLLAHVQPGVHQEPQVVFCQAAFQLGGPQNLLVNGVISCQVWDFALLLAEIPKIPVSPFLQPVEVPLGGSIWMTYQPLLPTLCHQKPCWEYPLPHCADN